MLRGAEGFGLRHHLRTDRILTLSEDLPLVSVAVDTRPRIESVLEDVIAIKRHGLITLERARMLTGEVGAVGAARGTARGDQAHDLRRAPRAGRRRSGVRLGVRPAPSSGHRRRDGAARGGRHRPRRAPAGALLRAQRRGTDDDHRGRCRRADHAGGAGARPAARAPAAHARAGNRVQARRRAPAPRRSRSPRPTSRAWRCGRS